MADVKRFRIEWGKREIEDVKSRVKNVRWPHEIPGQGWDYGTSVDYMKELADYWLAKYNWEEQLDYLNQFPHYRTEIDGLGMHFIKVDGKGPDPIPLIILHGYPWSVLTLYRIIPMLTDPAKFGGDPRKSFTVIAPSLCGFCLSDPIKQRAFNVPKHAEYYHRLMTEVLGIKKYAFQGGDWGGIIGWAYGKNYPDDFIGMHFHYMGMRMRDERPADELDPDIIRGLGLLTAPLRPREPDSLRYWKAAASYWFNQGAYAHVNITVPQSFSFAMCDSPIGIAAWFIEKFRAWSDWREHFEENFSKDHLITNAMLYYIPRTFSSAIKIYYESHNHPWLVKPGDKVMVPTAFVHFPKDIVPIIESRVRLYFNLVRFHDSPRGGHFGIHEQAEYMARDIREFYYQDLGAGGRA